MRNDHRKDAFIGLMVKPFIAGKSTLINRFLDQQGSHKATVGLEYIYCKKGNLLCNIWEGGGNFDTNLIKMIQVRSSKTKIVPCTLKIVPWYLTKFILGTLEKCSIFIPSTRILYSFGSFEFESIIRNLFKFSEISRGFYSQ